MVDIGKYIWVDDKDYLFLPGKIIEIEDNSYKVLVEIDGESETRTVEMDKYSEVHPSCLKGVDDLLLNFGFSYHLTYLYKLLQLNDISEGLVDLL